MTVARRTRRSIWLASVLCSLVAALVVAMLGSGTASAAGTQARHKHWASASSAKITPGVMMYTKGAQCTSNFVFTDASGGVYVGYAAHCAGLGGATDTNGCNVKSVPLGTKVTFNEGGSLLGEGQVVGHGTLAYSSWITEKKLRTRDTDTCAYNDLGLVKIARRDVKKVNPTVPFWGGPTGIDRNGMSAGDRVFTYGNSSLRAGLSPLAPHTGVSIGDTATDGGWSHPLYTAMPGVPGDSGSGFLSQGGKAIGVLSTIGIAPLPLSNNIGDLAKELAFARAHSGIPGLRLALGTRPFSPVL
ncbi:hypothetical protein [Nocardioides sp.]|jgi:hypothetical protein|uniref:hypothetical protein n=1 Tax=Nocardioides sp. TaxID=35761 RepID=UPI0031FF2A45|nr:hypothetical protein [Nocardioides sp.]